MTKRYPRGSEWRKWDLHVHVPGTKLSDAYAKSSDEPDFERFAAILEDSDVAVFGITDYFSADQTLAFIDYFKEHYPDSEKLLLVNIELRLNETVNSAKQMVDFHVLFRDSTPHEKIHEFLSRLNTEHTDANGRQKTCSELSGNEFNTATVTRTGIDNAFKETFGPKAEPTDYLLYLAPANNNGLRAQSGKQRKAQIADEIDKQIHAVFGKSTSNSRYFLKVDRYEDETLASKPKPVFGGCDAHSFEDLESWLGKAIDTQSTRQVITWVKADPTFAGLQQTLVEPSARVSIAELKPDAKDLYKVIKKVTFEGSSDFPSEIEFNPNLNAVIGSRSSGKSALLAHIAYAVDPDYTMTQQMTATQAKESELGPAAGITWQSVESTTCTVEWADGSTGGGQVIYIPQNWLYQISDNPKEVTEKIRPVLESRYPSYFREQQRTLDSVKSRNESIEKSVALWFDLAEDSEQVKAELKQLGDKDSIEKALATAKEAVETLRTENSLSAEDLEEYQKIISMIDEKNARLAEVDVEIEELSSCVIAAPEGAITAIPGGVTATTVLVPNPSSVPERLGQILSVAVEATETELVRKAEQAIIDYRVQLGEERSSLVRDVATLKTDNKGLIEKHKANTTLEELVKRQKKQQDSLDKILKLEERRDRIAKDQIDAVGEIGEWLHARANLLDGLKEKFATDERVLDQLNFGIAIGFDSTVIDALSGPFRKNVTGTFLKKEEGMEPVVDLAKAQLSPGDFLNDLSTKKQKLNQGNSPLDVARQVLTATPEVRYTATLDEDQIGGFGRSTMTPGKQALFALTLILGESEERWTLLIDQPEDDLDSRSIYKEIVRYLAEQKKQRQIILVTHNANLVVGADAEQVLIANRHGDDRKNRGGQTFDYLTGSLEHSQARKATKFDLDQMGIREHAVDVLDGGEEAFQKRRDKYKI